MFLLFPFFFVPPKWSCFMLFLLAFCVHPFCSILSASSAAWPLTNNSLSSSTCLFKIRMSSAVCCRSTFPYAICVPFSDFERKLIMELSWNYLINKLINLTIHVVLLRPYTCFFTCPDSVLGVPLSDPWHHAGFGPQSIEHIRSCLCTSAWNAKGRTCDFGRFASYLIIHVYSSKSRTSEIMGLFNVYCPTGWTQAPTFLWRACSFGRARLVERQPQVAQQCAAFSWCLMMVDACQIWCCLNLRNALIHRGWCVVMTAMHSMRVMAQGWFCLSSSKACLTEWPFSMVSCTEFGIWKFDTVCVASIMMPICCMSMGIFHSLGGTRCSLAIATFVQELLPLVNVFPRFFQQHIDLRCSMPSRTATTRSFCLNDSEEPAYWWPTNETQEYFNRKCRVTDECPCLVLIHSSFSCINIRDHQGILGSLCVRGVYIYIHLSSSSFSEILFAVLGVWVPSLNRLTPEDWGTLGGLVFQIFQVATSPKNPKDI